MKELHGSSLDTFYLLEYVTYPYNFIAQYWKREELVEKKGG